MSGPEPVPAPVPAAAEGPEPAPAGPDRATSALVAVRVVSVLVLVGALVGFVWWRVAPVAAVRIESGGGYYVDPDPETYIAADLWFAVLCVVAGLVAGSLLWRAGRRSATVAVAALAVGGLAGAFVAKVVGQVLGRADATAASSLPVGSITHVSLRLQSAAALVALPVAALLAWLVTDLVHDAREARREQAREVTAGWAPADLPEPEPAVSPDVPPQPPPPTSA